jgi:hypothetical protein
LSNTASVSSSPPLDGDLGAGNERLDEQRLARVVEHPADPPGRRVGLGRAVGADHSAAGRQRQRLDDDREAEARRELARRRAVRAGQPVCRLRHAGLLERLAHRRLVARAGDRIGIARLQTELRGRESGGAHALVVDGHDRVDRQPGRVLDDLGRGLDRVAQRQYQSAIAQELRHRLAPIGGDHQVCSQPRGGRREVVGAVRRTRQDQENARHPVIVGGR